MSSLFSRIVSYESQVEMPELTDGSPEAEMLNQQADEYDATAEEHAVAVENFIREVDDVAVQRENLEVGDAQVRLIEQRNIENPTQSRTDVALTESAVVQTLRNAGGSLEAIEKSRVTEGFESFVGTTFSTEGFVDTLLKLLNSLKERVKQLIANGIYLYRQFTSGSISLVRNLNNLSKRVSELKEGSVKTIEVKDIPSYVKETCHANGVAKSVSELTDVVTKGVKDLVSGTPSPAFDKSALPNFEELKKIVTEEDVKAYYTKLKTKFVRPTVLNGMKSEGVSSDLKNEGYSYTRTFGFQFQTVVGEAKQDSKESPDAFLKGLKYKFSNEAPKGFKLDDVWKSPLKTLSNDELAKLTAELLNSAKRLNGFF